MDIVERLRELAKIDNCQMSFEAADEIERLRQQNAELVEFVNKVANMGETPLHVYCVSELAELIIAKTTGGE